MSEPVKSIRTTIDGGGLTPIPDEGLNHHNARVTLKIDSSSIKELEEREKRTRSETDEIIQQVVMNRTKWRNMKKDVEVEPSSSEKVIMKINGNDELSEQDLAKIIKGMTSIMKNDQVLREKSTIARVLKKRRTRENTAATNNTLDTKEPENGTEQATSDDDDDYSSMFSSIMSSYKSISEKRSRSTTATSLSSDLDLDLKTFITEAKIGARKDQGKHLWAEKRRAVSDTSDQLLAREQKIDSLTGYKRGDFVERNKVLGKEARYYDALTEQEMHRVENILNISDKDFTSERVLEKNPGFSLSIKEEKILEDIDKSLQEIVPQSQWQSRNVSVAGTSGFRTPCTSVFDSAVENIAKKQVQSVLCNLETIKEPNIVLKDELDALKEIDEKLQALKEDQVEPVALSREVLDKLIFESLQAESEIREMNE